LSISVESNTQGVHHNDHRSLRAAICRFIHFG
jgi:hypothetical protein